MVEKEKIEEQIGEVLGLVKSSRGIICKGTFRKERGKR
jgi:hypothetical protein